MKIDTDDRWLCDLALYETKDGPELRYKDGRASLTEGTDAAKNQATIAGYALTAATKAKAEADGVKAS